MPERHALVLLFVTAALSACRDRAHAPGAPRPLASQLADAGAPPPSPAFAALQGDWMEKIELPDGGLAYVTPPVGATEPRPVIVAVHGAVDDAGLICSAWRLITDVYPFVVCPSGTPLRKDTYVWSSSDQIDKRVNQALEALRARYGDRVAQAPAIYTAFSQGANLAGPALIKNGKRIPRAALSEGGYGALEHGTNAAAFAKSGGDRVLFSCSQRGCAHAFEASRRALERAGVAVRIVDSGPHGHSMPPPVRESLNAALPWLIDGLPGWESYANAPKLASH